MTVAKQSALERTQVGTVEVLRHRIYTMPDGADVSVTPGTYPLVREPDGTLRWLMTGRRSARQPAIVEALGGGTFAVHPPYDDIISADEMVYPSKGFTRAEFRDFLATDPVVREGHPGQRLRIRVEVEL